MSLQLAFATAAICPTIHTDDAQLAASLAALGVQPTACVWNDPAVDWSRFDAVLMRSTWDYFQHYPQFLQWLDRLDALGVPTINDSRLLRWNSDKRYLRELAQLGVEIIPTEFARTAELPQALQAMRGQEVVVKPTVSGTAWRALRGVAGEAAFMQQIAGLPAGDWLLQPFMPEIQRDGEWSLLFFANAYSHAVRKLPKAGDYRVQGEHGGSATPAEPPAAALAAAQAVLAAVSRAGHAGHAYARVDGVLRNGRFLLMEVELIEPFLHLAARPDAAERFAEQLAARLARHTRQPPPERPMRTDASEYLFSYGTLQSEAVQLATFGHRLAGAPDALPGYRIEQLAIRDAQVVATSGATHHPIAMPSGNAADSVRGTVFRLTPQELAQADAYEVDDYRRAAVTLASGLRAWMYVRAE